MVLKRIMEDVRKVSDDTERKACVIGITQLLSANQAVMSKPDVSCSQQLESRNRRAQGEW